MKAARIIIRLLLTAVIIGGVYHDTRSVWLTCFCALVSMALEMNGVLTDKMIKTEKDVVEMLKEMVKWRPE